VKEGILMDSSTGTDFHDKRKANAERKTGIWKYEEV